MKNKTKVDTAGRIVIPKELRERYGLTPDREVHIIPLPDGISLIPARSKRRIIRKGRITAIDTGADTATLDLFDVSRLRDEHFNSIK